MNMLDMMLGPFLSDPRIKAVLDDIPNLHEQWKRLNATLRYLEGASQALDNKAAFLIREVEEVNEKLTLLLSETHLTPDLHAGALAMAAADPRNHPPAL